MAEPTDPKTILARLQAPGSSPGQALGAVEPCTRCGHGQHTLLATGAQEVRDAGRLVTLPTVWLACRQCGALVAHAVQVLEGQEGDAGS
jgi:hypothetical protein